MAESIGQRGGVRSWLLHFCLLFYLLVPVVGAQPDERVNINTASAEELMRLPGIGPTIAVRIVEYRRKHGPFKRPQEIIIVHRMNAKLYRRIVHLIRT
ncbi:MAG TPA: helix-hairpin-helix domain-containing protein [Blastocatellia bacterium]|nr:helix-hairpin-helix domain-containing protein [Blastocatellia bacterium]